MCYNILMTDKDLDPFTSEEVAGEKKNDGELNVCTSCEG